MGQTDPLALVWQTAKKKENSIFKPIFGLKSDLVSHPTHGEVGWVNTYMYFYDPVYVFNFGRDLRLGLKTNIEFCVKIKKSAFEIFKP